MSENKRIKMTLADGTTIEGTAEELAKLQKLFPSADASEEESSEFVPGDYAKVTGPTFYGDIREGTIVKITSEKASDGEYAIDCVNPEAMDYDYADESSLEKLELSNMDISFLRNGRDIGEFKEGDIAEVLNYVGGDEVGTIVEVTHVNGTEIRASAAKTRGAVPYHYRAGDLKLIALAEKRADVDA